MLVTELDVTIVAAAMSQLGQSVGFSVDLDGNAPSTGYMVGDPSRPHRKIASDVASLPHMIARKIVEHLCEPGVIDALEEGHFLGGWRDDETGDFYLDLSERFEDLNSALFRA